MIIDNVNFSFYKMPCQFFIHRYHKKISSSHILNGGISQSKLDERVMFA